MSISDARVGFKCPPRHSQFVPGQSGNPSGRPRRKPSLADDIAAELEKPSSIVRGGEKLSNQAAIAQRLIAQAVEGDQHAIAALLKLTGGRPAAAEPEVNSGLNDAAVIESFERRAKPEQEVNPKDADDGAGQ